ncbi:MAG: alanine racemase [Lachnospiraceae bacterium]|nr:alanine racemase [Lachnospiraceae bacterium]
MSYKRIWAEIDLNNLIKNMNNFHSIINDSTKIICVIKADGYGHGAVKLANELIKLPYLHGFAVATAEEAFELREAGIFHPILILGYTFKEDYEQLIEQNISLTVFTKEMADEISEAACKINKDVLVHVKVDTGMSRIGITPDDNGLEIVKYIASKRNTKIEGMFTHFARADELDKTKANAQLKKYSDFVKLVTSNGIEIPIKHCSNSAGIIEMKDANFDVVRAGITLYGLWPSNEVTKDVIPLYPLMTLKSSVVCVKDLEPGREISYGGTYTTKDTRKIATISAGYADGIPRGLSNKGYVLIRGKKAPIVGRVCMDQFMVDVTDIDSVTVRDEVVIIGSQGNETITAEEVGDISGRFNYELVCDITKRVPRIYKTN